MTVLDEIEKQQPRVPRLKLSLNKSGKRLYPFKERESLSPKRPLTDMNGLIMPSTSSSSSITCKKNGITQSAPIAALSNMGNTCFLNSVLYSLRFTPTFLHNLHHLAMGLSLNKTSVSKTASLGRSFPDTVPKTKVQIVTEKLHEVYMAMHAAEIPSSQSSFMPDTESGSLQPLAFVQALKQANSLFDGNHQQDAHELFIYLIDHIRETCDVLAQMYSDHLSLSSLTVSNPTSCSESTTPKFFSFRKKWKKISNRNQLPVDSNSHSIVLPSRISNFIVDDFQGVTLRRTKCLQCENVSERKEPFYDIPVPIPTDLDEILNDKDNTIGTSASDVFRKFCVTSEKLCDSNKYLCDFCQTYTEASREVLFEKLPNVMVLQLKRFTSSPRGVQKVNTYLPTPLDLDCFCKMCCDQLNSRTHEGSRTNNINNATPLHKYGLRCVIMHLGASMASGHYIAYVRATPNPDTSQPLSSDYSECKMMGNDSGTPTSNSSDGGKQQLTNSSVSGALVGNSDKPHGLLKLLKPRSNIWQNSGSSSNVYTQSAGSSSHPAGAKSGVGCAGAGDFCRGAECCGIRLNKTLIENYLNSLHRNHSTPQHFMQHNQNYYDYYTNGGGGDCDDNAMLTNRSDEDLWLECDDECVRAISGREFEEELSYKPNSTCTPYLLFYHRMPDDTSTEFNDY